MRPRPGSGLPGGVFARAVRLAAAVRCDRAQAGAPDGRRTGEHGGVDPVAGSISRRFQDLRDALLVAARDRAKQLFSQIPSGSSATDVARKYRVVFAGFRAGAQSLVRRWSRTSGRAMSKSSWSALQRLNTAAAPVASSPGRPAAAIVAAASSSSGAHLHARAATLGR